MTNAVLSTVAIERLVGAFACRCCSVHANAAVDRTAKISVNSAGVSRSKIGGYQRESLRVGNFVRKEFESKEKSCSAMQKVRSSKS